MSSTSVLLHWAVLDIEQYLTDTGYKIVVTTNHPCHLWMRWTNRQPWKHIEEFMNRGVFIGKDYRQCFTVYDNNEQEETGDTLEHTFWKEPWPFCETRWFYFYGTVNEVDSPSESPIFTKHRTGDFGWMMLELWQFDYEPPPMRKWCYEPWTYYYTPPTFTLDWTFWEPWGTYLRQYNNWRYLNPPPEVGVSFEDGVIKLTSPGNVDIGIAFYPPANYPLRDASDHPLRVRMNNPNAAANDDTSAIALAGYFTHPTERTLYFQLLIAYGADTIPLCPFGTAVAWNHDWVWQCVGLGENDIDLLDLWARGREALGKSTDPTGWVLDDFHFGLHNAAPGVEDWLKNDYLGFYYEGTGGLILHEPWTGVMPPPPVPDIDIGADAIDRPNYTPYGYTFISAENPANAAGTITLVKLFVTTDLANCEVAIFYKVNATTFTTRSNATLGTIPAGYSEHAVNLAVQVGDYIGIYFPTGTLDRNDTGGLGAWYKLGDYIPCTTQAFTLSAGRTLSLYGSGYE